MFQTVKVVNIHMLSHCNSCKCSNTVVVVIGAGFEKGMGVVF